ncbi:MAG: oxidoreductase [Desulfitobacteriaceae bacterium]
MWSLLRRSLKTGRLLRGSRHEVRGSRFGHGNTDNTEDRNLDALQESTMPATFRQSLQLRHLDCGSCNGCDWELTALSNSFYDLQRFGLDFVASPRHADLLMCTGTGSTQLLTAARATYEAMAKPKLVMAVGNCAIDGGVFKGAYASEEGLAEVLPVDFKVPGCPPSPDDILNVLRRIMGKY